jgi:TfoX/Sxy family transcriptional regulator of competence genes
MASTKDFAEFITGQLENRNGVALRKMFGEYAVYRGNKVVALICDNQLYVKPTVAGRKFIGAPVEAPPYPGAKPYFLIEDKIEDGEWLSDLIGITYRDLPEPKPKKVRHVR